MDFKGFSSFSSCLRVSASNDLNDIYTSPRTSRYSGAFGIRFGRLLIVIRFSVTSSPTEPSPRVEPLTKTPFSYSHDTERPSNLGSTT